MNQKVLGLSCVAAGIFLTCCPFFLSAYWLRILTNIFMFAILSQAINIISGYTGYPAFGNVVFFGLGAYSTGVLMVKFHLFCHYYSHWNSGMPPFYFAVWHTCFTIKRSLFCHRYPRVE